MLPGYDFLSLRQFLSSRRHVLTNAAAHDVMKRISKKKGRLLFSARYNVC